MACLSTILLFLMSSVKKENIWGCNSRHTAGNCLDWRENHMSVIDAFKFSIISGLSWLLYVKTGARRIEWIRSSTDSPAMKVLSESAMVCTKAWMLDVEILVVFCKLEVSGCNDSCQKIMNTQIERTGLLQCNDFPIINSQGSFFTNTSSLLETQMRRRPHCTHGATSHSQALDV